MLFRKRFEEFFEDILSFFLRPSLSERLVITGALVGTTAGFAAYLFIRLINFLSHWTIEQLPRQISFWRYTGYLFFPALGAFLGYILIRFFCPEAHGHGTEVLNVLPEKSPWLSARVAIIKLIASALTIGLGGSAGQEGPVIQIGGATASFLGKYLRVPDEDIRVLISAGASLSGPLGHLLTRAALARGSFAIAGTASVVTSSYRAPITGIIMALEMSRDYGIVMPAMAASISPKKTPSPLRFE